MTGQELRSLRRNGLKLSQAALASELGVHALTVSRWELGRCPIPGPAARLVELLAGVQSAKSSDGRLLP